MLRTFTEEQLNQMCAKRPEGYKEDILALSRRRPDGIYEIDTESDAYIALRAKYEARPLIRFNREERKRAERMAETAKSSAAADQRLQLLNMEELYSRGLEVAEVLGGVTEFSMKFAEVKQVEAAGGCRSCARRKYLTRVLEAFIASASKSSPEVISKLRAMFPSTLYVRLSPTPLKWDDLLKLSLKQSST